MANIFPRSGNVGIGTTSPHAPLHVQSGSALLAIFQSVSPNVGPAYIQITASNANYTWQISNQDGTGGNTANGLAFIEQTATPPGPGVQVARVYFQQGGNVGVGIMSSRARFAVASPLYPQAYAVQIHGGAIVPAGMSALAIGYGDAYDSIAIGDAAYAQAEHQGVQFRELLVNPIAGAVGIGTLQTQFTPPDVDPNGNRYGNPIVPPLRSGFTNAFPRFGVSQYVSSGSVVLAGYDMATVANAPATVITGRASTVMSGGVAGGSGSGSLRAGLANTVVTQGASGTNGRWGIEIGLHSAASGNTLTRTSGVGDSNVGMYVKSSHTGWLASGVRNDAGVYITGEDGWFQALTYQDTPAQSNRLLFQITLSGGIKAVGQNSAGSAWKFTVDENLATVLMDGTFAAVGSPHKVYVDTSGQMYAADYHPPVSSRAAKQDISSLASDEALALLGGLNPLSFRYRRDEGPRHLGFIAEDAPGLAVSPDGDAVGLMQLVTILTATYKAQRDALRAESNEADRLRREIEVLLLP